MTRLFMAVAFVVLPEPSTRIKLIVAASITDYFDGFIARRANLTTKWGALIDPIADRLFVFTAVCVYLFEGAIGSAQYFMLIARDLMTAIGFLVARSVSWLRPVAFRARIPGKIVTTLQLAALIAVLMFPHRVSMLIYLVGITSLWAIVDYTLMLWRERERSPA